MKLSIIVPVYNTSKYLGDCLDSLLKQDLDPKEYEIICVNDGSTDQSLEILQRYESLNFNIKIINQNNSGHAAARNTGLFASKGKYVWFFDSDDYVDSNCFSFLLTTIENNKIDFLTIGLKNVPENSFYRSIDKVFNFKPGQTAKNMATSGNRIILRSLLTENYITWNEKLSPNDCLVFLFYISLVCKKSEYIDSINYYWRQNPNSTSHAKNLKARKKHLNSFIEMAKIYQTEYIKYELNPKVSKNIKQRIGLSVKGILFDAALIYTSSERKQMLQSLKADKLYPYSILWFDLIPKISFKRTLMDWSTILFPFEIYYDFYCYILYKTKTARLHRR